jgi:hypothetical protein
LTKKIPLQAQYSVIAARLLAFTALTRKHWSQRQFQNLLPHPPIPSTARILQCTLIDQDRMLHSSPKCLQPTVSGSLLATNLLIGRRPYLQYRTWLDFHPSIPILILRQSQPLPVKPPWRILLPQNKFATCSKCKSCRCRIVHSLTLCLDSTINTLPGLTSGLCDI